MNSHSKRIIVMPVSVDDDYCTKQHPLCTAAASKWHLHNMVISLRCAKKGCSCKCGDHHLAFHRLVCREERKRRHAKKKRAHKNKEAAKAAEAAARAAASGDSTALAGRKSLAAQLAAATSSGLIKKGMPAGGGKSDYGKSSAVFGKLAEQAAAGKEGKKGVKGGREDKQQMKGAMLKL